MFPVFVTSAGGARTTFHITAGCPAGDDACPILGSSLRLRLQWVCPGAAPSGVCASAGDWLQLPMYGSARFTANGTVSLPQSGTITKPPCDKGYLIAWVVDDSGRAIKRDALLGTALVQQTSGGTLSTYSALAIPAGGALATGQVTDANGNGALDFDGVEYERLPELIAGPVRYDRPNGDVTVATTLTLLTLDVASNRANAETSVPLNFYTPTSDPLPAAVRFTCWTQKGLSEISRNLRVRTAGRAGLVTSASAATNVATNRTVGVIGVLETREVDSANPTVTQAYVTELFGNDAGAAAGRKPDLAGSLLVFPKFVSGYADRFAATTFQVTASCPTEESCPAAETLSVRLQWVCPGTPGTPSGCPSNGTWLTLGMRGTVEFTANGTVGLPNNGRIPAPPCERGYLVLWVVDDFGKPIKRDALLGLAIVRDAEGTIASYGAIPIKAGRQLPSKGRTDLNGNGALDFDGVEYQEVPPLVAAPLKYDQPGGDTGSTTVLTLLTIDANPTETTAGTHIPLNFFGTRGRMASTSASFTCWVEKPLSEIDTALRVDSLGVVGLVEASGPARSTVTGQAVPVLGIIQTREFDRTAPTRTYASPLFGRGRGVPGRFGALP